MECNKEEAEKCKAISEASLKNLDLAAARKFALKAKQLFPELDGLAQLCSILDVYVAAHEKLRSGESNWYAILQVDFRADENTIRKQYRKLALFLHPDKNKVFGAEAAFKHISEAWSVLSDGKKKSDYDKRWFAHMAAQRTRSPYTAHNSSAFRARENLSKHHKHAARQCPRHVHQDQLHRQAQQGQSQGPGKVHAQKQGQIPVDTHQQQGQNHQHQGNRQGQSEAHPHQQQVHRQGIAHADQHQSNGQAFFQQQGQAHASQQAQDAETHVQQQIKARAHQHQQGQVHAHQKQWQGQLHGHQQEGQGRAQAHYHQQQQRAQSQQGQGQAEHQGQGQAHAHQQQQQNTQGKVHVQQQGQGQDHSHQQGGEGQAQGQGCAHIQTQGGGEGHVSQQGQHQARVPQRGQHQYQGVGEASVDQQQEPRHEAQHAECKQAHVTNSSFAPEKWAFWTACPHCKMQLEYDRAYMNKKLCCPMCYSPFLSKEIEPVQGPILWPGPKQQHKEALEEDFGNKTCPVEKFERIPEADLDMPEIVRHEKKTKRGKQVNSPQQKFQQSPKATIRAEERRVKQKQEQKKKMRDQRKFDFQTNCVEKLLATMKEVINQERSKERDNPAVDKASAHMSRRNAADRASASMPFVQNIPAASDQTARVGSAEGIKNDANECNRRATNHNSAGTKENGSSLEDVDNTEGKAYENSACNPRFRTQKASGSSDIGGSSASMINVAAIQAPACRPFEQSIPPAIEQNAYVGKKVNDADECNLKIRTCNSARKKAFIGPLVNIKAPVSTAALDQTANVGNMEGKANGVHDSAGSRKGSCLSKLGSSKMEISQLKRKLVSSPIDGLEGIGALKKLRQSSNQVESESHRPLNHSKSSDGSSLQEYGADNSRVEYEMEVPDSDFYNFDEDRTEKHFAVGQIWATYDDDDGMPRYYARVNKILSIQPLKMQMNWLEARNPTDETLAWLNAGFQHTCGDFKLGSLYTADQVSTFSHLMTVDKVSKGVYKIYPRQGDVWAVYKEWELLKVSDDNRGYDMVEIMATFDGKSGVQVAPLAKVAGFKTIFERKPGEEYMKWIFLHEIRRFSHQVPAYPIVAGKVPGIEVDCLEIDPASTPMNLIIGDQ